MKAIILVTAKVGASEAVMEKLVQDGFNVATLAGVYDLAAFLEVADERDLGKMVIGKIQATPGILNTVTLIELDYVEGGDIARR